MLLSAVCSRIDRERNDSGTSEASEVNSHNRDPILVLSWMSETMEETSPTTATASAMSITRIPGHAPVIRSRTALVSRDTKHIAQTSGPCQCKVVRSRLWDTRAQRKTIGGGGGRLHRTTVSTFFLLLRRLSQAIPRLTTFKIGLHKHVL